MHITSGNVLLIDDDSDALLSLARAIKGILAEVHFEAFTSPQKALENLEKFKAQVAVIDLSLDKNKGVESGFELLTQILQSDPTCRVVVLTGHGSSEYGIRAINNGAASFLQKPADLQHLSALIVDGINQSNLKREFQRVKSQSTSQISDFLVGTSEQIQTLRKNIEYAGNINQAVLISGETGTGKGLCAQAIHKFGNRAQYNFVRYQPNFANSDLTNSDLFGHLKGAFTGAEKDRAGLIEEADRGTLFLDEVDELPLETQVTLLGVLQEKKFRQLGSSKEQGIDFRLICATNQDLDKCLQSGKLRKDFFHRIAHLHIVIPPLRERLQDLKDLTLAIIMHLREREGINISNLSQAALDKMLSYNWPGNVRELEAVVEGACYRANFERRLFLEAQDIRVGRESSTEKAQNFHDKVEQFKRKLIDEALQTHNGNQVKAAQELGLDRTSLRRILSRSN